MPTAGNTPRNAAPLACRPISAAAPATAASSSASCIVGGAARLAGHMAAVVAAQNPISAAATAIAVPWPPGAGRAWKVVVTTNAIAATASTRIAR